MADEIGNLIEGLADTWTSLTAVCAELSPDDWAAPTGCPGWSVQDNVAHIAGLELELMGRASTHVLPDSGLDHVRNDVGRWMEVTVDERRPCSPDQVLAELRAVTSERLAQLRAMDDAGLDADAPGPMGMAVTTRQMLPIRVFDCWAHEQDIRRAVGEPGGLEGPAASISFDRMIAGLRAVVPKVLADASGLADQSVTSIGFDITGPGGRQFTLTLTDGAGTTEQGLPKSAAVTITTDLPTFTGYCCGRSTDDRPADVAIDGDTELAARVLGALGFTP